MFVLCKLYELSNLNIRKVTDIKVNGWGRSDSVSEVYLFQQHLGKQSGHDCLQSVLSQRSRISVLLLSQIAVIAKSGNSNLVYQFRNGTVLSLSVGFPFICL